MYIDFWQDEDNVSQFNEEASNLLSEERNNDISEADNN